MDIKEYFAPPLKWWWLIVISTLVAGGASYLATQQQPDVYQSSTALMIGNPIENPNPSNNELFITQQLASAYVNLANRPALRRDVQDALELNWLPNILVRPINNTNIVEIIVADTNPDRAQAVAAEMARQLILRSPTSNQDEQSFVNELLANYETAIRETRDELAVKQDELGVLVSAREIASVQTEMDTLETSLRTLETNYATLLASTQQGATNTVTLIEPANRPYFPIDPNDTISLLTAAGLGFVLSVAAAYVLEYLDDTVKTPNQISRVTDLPTLAGIAEIKSKNERLITFKKPRSPISEAFRVLRTGIQFTSVDEPNRSILVTSATPFDGKSTTSANLAVVLAQAGNSVLLVDADLRRPNQQNLFDLPNKRGLTSLLLDFDLAQSDDELRILVNDVVQTTWVEGLQVLTCGPIPPNPSELLGSKKMRELITSLVRQFDYVILDSPPALSVTDPVVLSTQVQAVLLVVRAGKTKRGHAKQAVQLLDEVNANMIGCVLNSLSPREEGYNSYYYYRDPYYVSESVGSEVVPEKKPGKLRRRFLRGTAEEAVQSRS